MGELIGEALVVISVGGGMLLFLLCLITENDMTIEDSYIVDERGHAYTAKVDIDL